jgi:hypothetical protein
VLKRLLFVDYGPVLKSVLFLTTVSY